METTLHSTHVELPTQAISTARRRPTFRLAAALVAACAAAAPACKTQRFTDASLASASVQAAYQEWRNASATLDPGAATARGDHRFDNDLEPPTKERVARAVEVFHQARKSLNQYFDENLTGDPMADRKLVLNRIECDLIAFEQLKIAERDLGWSAQVAMRAFTSLEASPDLEKGDRASAFVARLRALPNYFAGVRGESNFPWSAQAELAVAVTDSLSNYLDGNVLERIGDTRPPAAEALKAAQDATKTHLDWLNERVTIGPQGHHRVHRATFDAILRYESGLELDANTVGELAQAELEGARKRFEAAARKAMPQKEDVESAVAATLQALSTGRPLDLATLQMLANDASADTLAFCKGTLVATLPDRLHLDSWVGAGGTYTGDLAALTTAVGDRTKTVDATITYAGPISVLPAAAQEEWLSAFSPVRLRMLALSEGVPGIALERTVRAGNPSPPRRDIASEAFERGWGDYARRTALAAGFGQLDPLMPAAAAATDLVVAARALCAARIHAGSMTVTEAREIFRLRALLPPEVANLEARRCATDPCVALELVGRIELEKLVGELQAQKGFSPAAARDRLLRSGALPFDALRMLLLPTGSN